MDDAQQIQAKLLSLGERYLRRTYTELDQLESALGELRANSAGAAKELERMLHKIRGSGAMFGFAELSECAGRGELLCVSNADDPALESQLQACVQDLRAQVHAAARTRRISLEHGSSSPAGCG